MTKMINFTYREPNCDCAEQAVAGNFLFAVREFCWRKTSSREALP